jgi:hypothetical protein
VFATVAVEIAIAAIPRSLLKGKTMTDPCDDFQSTVKRTFEGLFKLAGVELTDSASPAHQSFQIPVTSLTIDELREAQPEVAGKVNANINRAFDEVMGVLKIVKPRPKASRVVVTVSRKAYMFHVYVTIETFNEVPHV